LPRAMLLRKRLIGKERGIEQERRKKKDKLTVY
jgi:hypothetical protein